MTRLCLPTAEFASALSHSKVTMPICVDKQIVEVILDEMLIDDNDEDDCDAPSATKMFELVSEEETGERYETTWTNKLQFDLIVSFVAVGVSFRQAENLLNEAKKQTGLGCIGSLSVGKVTNVVRLVCALNFQTMSCVMQSVWAFSIAVDGGTKCTVPYLDVRARFCVGRKLFNIHVVALPMYNSHTGQNMTDVIIKFFDAIAPDWKQKLISVSTDGASNMTGRHNGVVSLLDRHCLPESGSGIYRVWCGAHQLDLVVQGI